MEEEQTVNILLVDDEPANLIALQAILEPLGQNLVFADSGAEALRCVLQQDFAVILLDVQLPDMDGFETAVCIRERVRSQHTPIVFVTAMYENTDHVSKGYSVGAIDYITKPIDPVILRSKVSAFVNLYKMSEQTRQQSLIINALNQELEARVIELDAKNKELARMTEELIQARDQALEASRSKSTFLANMSHEIRTPMNGVIGMIDSLLRTPLNAGQQEFARIIQDSADVLLDIISDILDFSKIEAGKLELEIVDFDVWQVMEDTIDLLASRAKRKKLSLKSFISPDIPRVLKGDPSRLRQVLINLASNAIKFTEKGEVVLRANAVNWGREQATIRFSVQDTGIGIAPASAKLLFQPFAQADGSVTRRYGGTGLGLAISRHLVEIMGGEIGLESLENVGSTFWFSVPLKRSSLSAVRSAKSRLAAESSAEAEELKIVSESRKPILVAEDNPVNQKVALHQLRELGFVAHIVASGREAVAASLRNSYQLILMDCQMPDMDGFQATAEIRKTEAVSGTRMPIIALTAHAVAGDRDRCLKSGMDDYISKPVTQKKLKAVLAKWLNKPGPNGDGAVEPIADSGSVAASASEPVRRAVRAPIDLTMLRDTLGSDEIDEVLTLFLSSTGPLLKKLESALSTRDTDSLKRIAHELKGSSATMGANDLAQLSREMEITVADKDWERAAEVFTQMSLSLDKLSDYVAQTRDNNGSQLKKTDWGASVCQSSRDQRSS